MAATQELNPYEPPRQLSKSWLPFYVTIGLAIILSVGSVIAFMAWRSLDGGIADMQRGPIHMDRGPVRDWQAPGQQEKSIAIDSAAP